MDKSLFQNKPVDDYCTCIICHKPNKLRSDEHIIPKAIGGYLHTWDVCKECNSKFGDNVDSLLVDHYFIQWERYFQQLKGESKSEVPNPLEGTRIAKDGEKYRVTNDKGVITPHVIQHFSMSDDGKVVRLTIDPKDQQNAMRMMEKYCNRRGIPFDKGQISVSEIKTSTSPSFEIQTEIDISAFRLGILKIAYEFTACLIPNYVKDSLAQVISSILHDADTEGLKKLIISSGFSEDIFQKCFGQYVDFSRRDRHYIWLHNFENELYCFVKLFNVFSVGIKMSDINYPEVEFPIFAFNDISKNDFDLYSLPELAAACLKDENHSFIFRDPWNQKLQTLSNCGFYAAKDGSNICYSPDGQPIGSMRQVLENIPEDACVDEIRGDQYITSFMINGKLSFLLHPTNQLVPVKTIIVSSHIKKL